MALNDSPKLGRLINVKSSSGAAMTPSVQVVEEGERQAGGDHRLGQFR